LFDINGGVYDCDDCEEAYEIDGEAPPCQECKKPWLLFDSNKKAFDLWELCNLSRRYIVGLNGAMPERISPVDIKAICEGMNGKEEFEKVLRIEVIAYPKVLKDFNGSKSSS